MSKTSAIDPQWVLCNGVLCNASEFAYLPSKERPATTCPLCEQPVVLKLGKVRAHHYAHREEANCTAGHPETALHLNTKFHFYNELLQATMKTLRVQQRCDSSCCGKKRRVMWLKGWDAVEVEYRLNPFRPDVALLREGKVVAAIEVLVTHAVDESKVEFFEAQGIPWVEIRASESLYQGKQAWRTTSPLPLDVSGSNAEEWTCAPCRQRQVELERQREFERHNYTEIY